MTVTQSPAYPPPSSPAALAAASSSRAAASASAAASAQETHDNHVRVGVGVGVGVGGAALILAVAAFIFFPRRSARNREKMRAQLEAEQHSYSPPVQKDLFAELSAANHPMVEADEGRPRDPELPTSEPTSRSTSKTLRNSGYGMSRFMGRPAVPDKDMTQDPGR